MCGATVQGVPHIGHVRSSLNYDVLRRWLTAGGLDVAFVRNVTDIDDKILHQGSRGAQAVVGVGGGRTERAFLAAYDALGCLPSSVEPRATGHVTQMVELMQRLVESDHAYAAGGDCLSAAGGDVYFDVRSVPDYGALSGQRLDDVVQARATEAGGKRDPRDFTLWKAAKPGEPAWSTPRGGRVGRAGTWSARRWRPSTSGRSSTSTAAASTSSSRTTRTSGRRATRSATRSRGSGCTTPGSPSAGRR